MIELFHNSSILIWLAGKFLYIYKLWGDDMTTIDDEMGGQGGEGDRGGGGGSEG